MDFLIPAIMLKPDQWNHICIEYRSDSSRFGLKVNKSYYEEPTLLPILNLHNKREFCVRLDTRNVVER